MIATGMDGRAEIVKAGEDNFTQFMTFCMAGLGFNDIKDAVDANQAKKFLIKRTQGIGVGNLIELLNECVFGRNNFREGLIEEKILVFCRIQRCKTKRQRYYYACRFSDELMKNITQDQSPP